LATAEFEPLAPSEALAAPETVAEALPPAHSAPEAEYEPGNASASYKVDPTAPSELRIPGLANLTAALGFPPAAKESGEPEAPAAVAADEHPQHADQLHDADGDAFALDYEERAPRLSAAAEAQQRDAESSHPPFEVVGQLQGFAPGSGVLEEEVMDEEESDYAPIEAHGEDDYEELEEETLDHRNEVQVDAAVLGDAVRDSHLNQRLGQGAEAEAESEEQDDEPASFGFDEVEEDDEDEDEGAVTVPAAQPDQPRREGGRGRMNGRGRRGAPGGNGDGRGRRASSQLSNLPVISELLKQGQEILVQIAKEPIAKKGARITSHIALPGRFLVFMPTVNHVGVSRKIASDEERQRLKRILISEKGDFSGGFIVRTAAENASEDDLRADLRFLMNLWSEIKQRSDSGKAPALIYHDLNLIERILRDQVSSNFSTIWVDSEAEYERILRFLHRFQPQLVRRVKLYTKETPLFEQFGIQEEITKALKSKVWLKSGGSIVINQTEALVAIDINTGKYVGKTARLEDTIVKTNLDAIPEIVRQIRLRDLGGIIVIDFIDMDDRRNRNKVLAALEEALKADRAPSKVLQFNDFGLVAITRKRVKQSLERTLSVTCETCTGTGMVKSPTTVCNEIYTEMRKMQKHFERGDVMLRVNPEVVKQLKLNNGKWITELEEMIAKTIIIKSDPALHPEQFDIH
jgi:ribonuclease G